jgi:hypothetical protein
MAIAAVPLTALACAGHGAVRDGAMGRASDLVRVSVKNVHDTPLTIYAVGSAGTLRIGKVLPTMSGDFVLPRVMVGNGPVELVAYGDGSEPARSGPLLLLPGHRVEFVVSRPTYKSTASIQRP